MAKFRKKPVVIEAIKCNEVSRVVYSAQEKFLDLNMPEFWKAWGDLPQWISDAVDGRVIIVWQDHVVIKTLEGNMIASLGDWIIRGVNGELYPCKSDIFEKTYESVEVSN